MAKEFYNRKIELSLLRGKYERLTNGEMLAIYGRRRVGKTELVKEFMKNLSKDEKFYFYVDLSSKQEVLNSLSSALQEQLGESVRFAGFDDFLEYVIKKSEQRKFLLV